MQSIKEFEINKRESHSVKGRKGFIKLDNKKDIQLKFVIDKTTKSFLDEYCQNHGITKTQLLMGALQYYTGFNGENADEILKQN